MTLPKEVQELIEADINLRFPVMQGEEASDRPIRRATFRKMIMRGAEIYHAALPSLSREGKDGSQDLQKLTDAMAQVIRKETGGYINDVWHADLSKACAAVAIKHFSKD